ncbi:hypothetical protein HPB48_000166 [Haemaphysalis longicornis]|uniref:Monocarboxylate transporter n=1 Tax=Haemaphysalis longicornis TaxID=44386 RepID=A0A9J6GUI4_HAELO|nr:hypothetical protein HPB48_000166 [Haemaphysalis longicornis]
MAMVIVIYFSKYRGIAMGLKDAGRTIAVLVFPTIVSKLYFAYGVRGTLCVCGALVMHATALVLTLRKPPLARTRRVISHGNSAKLKASAPSASRERFSTIVDRSTDSGGDSIESLDNDYALSARTAKPTEAGSEYWRDSSRTQTNAQKGEQQKSKTDSFLANTAPEAEDSFELTSVQMNFNDNACTWNVPPLFQGKSPTKPPPSSDGSSKPEDTKHSEPMQGQTRFSIDSVRTTKLYLSCGMPVCTLLTDARFYVLFFQNTIANYSGVIFRSLMVDYAMDKGVPEHHAQLIGTYCALTDIAIGHVVIPVLADRSFVNKTLLVAATVACFSSLLFVLPEVEGFTFFLAVYGPTGALLAAMTSLSPVIIAEYLGVERVPVAYGASGLVTGPLLLVTPSITG